MNESNWGLSELAPIALHEDGEILQAMRDLRAHDVEGLDFTNTASAPLVRSSYHADQQAHGAGVA